MLECIVIAYLPGPLPFVNAAAKSMMALRLTDSSQQITNIPDVCSDGHFQQGHQGIGRRGSPERLTWLMSWWRKRGPAEVSMQLLLLELHCAASAGHLERMLEHFEAFYQSSEAQPGKEGAAGFGAWAASNGRKLPEGLPGQIVTEPDMAEEEEPGGWSGWQELLPEVPAEEAADSALQKQDKKVCLGFGWQTLAFVRRCLVAT